MKFSQLCIFFNSAVFQTFQYPKSCSFPSSEVSLTLFPNICAELEEKNPDCFPDSGGAGGWVDPVQCSGSRASGQLTVSSSQRSNPPTTTQPALVSVLLLLWKKTVIIIILLLDSGQLTLSSSHCEPHSAVTPQVNINTAGSGVLLSLHQSRFYFSSSYNLPTAPWQRPAPHYKQFSTPVSSFLQSRLWKTTPDPVGSPLGAQLSRSSVGFHAKIWPSKLKREKNRGYYGDLGGLVKGAARGKQLTC